MNIRDWDQPDPIIDDGMRLQTAAPHPKALLHFSIARFFERIAHFGTRSFLIFYFIDRFGQTDVEGSYRMYGILAALVVFAQIPGGLIVDLVMGRKTAVTWGGLSLAVGYFVLAFGNIATDAIGFLLIFCGMGLYGPAMFTSLGSFYEGRKPYLLAGLSYHFAAINAGAAASLLLVGGLAASWLSWRQGFMLCGIAMMAGHVYLLVLTRAYGEPVLSRVDSDETLKPGEGKPPFPTALAGLLIAVFAVYWIYHGHQFRVLREWATSIDSGFDLTAPLSISLSGATIAVLFLGGIVLTARPANSLRQMGLGYLVAAAFFSAVLGAAWLSGFNSTLESGLLITGVVIVAMAFAEFMIVPSLYAYIMNSQVRRYPNMLIGFATAAAYLPALIFIFPEMNGWRDGWSALITIAGTGVLTLTGYWLIKKKAK